MKIYKVCTQCNKSYSTYSGAIKNSNKTYCSSVCYGLWQRSKSFEDQNKTIRPIKICSIDDCDKVHFGRTYCKHHYSKNIEYANKEPIIPKEKIENLQCVQCNKSFRGRSLNNKFPKFCSRPCFGLNIRKAYIIKKGYKKVLDYNHPRSDKKGYVFEHIVVMEKHLNRPITKIEVIHHIDHDRGNNNIDNLMLFPNHSDHMKFHLEND